MNDPVYITGKCHYASITEPNTKFDPVWSIQVEVNDDNREVVEKSGLKVANKGDERGDFVTIKRKVHRKDGTQRNAPLVMDSQNNRWNNDKKIANGSTVNVKAIPYEWDYAGNQQDFAPVDGGYVQESDAVPF